MFSNRLKQLRGDQRAVIEIMAGTIGWCVVAEVQIETIVLSAGLNNSDSLKINSAETYITWPEC